MREESVGRSLVRSKLQQTVILMDGILQAMTPVRQTVESQGIPEDDGRTTPTTPTPSMSPSPIRSENRKLCMRCFRQWDRKLVNDEAIPECRFGTGQRRRKKCNYCSERRSECILVSPIRSLAETQTVYEQESEGQQEEYEVSYAPARQRGESKKCTWVFRTSFYLSIHRGSLDKSHPRLALRIRHPSPFFCLTLAHWHG